MASSPFRVSAGFAVEDSTWKEAFGRPSKLFRCLPPAAFLACRVAITLAWFGTFMWSVLERYYLQWLTYLTHWTMVFELVYLSLATYLTYNALYVKDGGARLPDGKGATTPTFVRIVYGMQTVTYILSFFVAILYWALLFNPDKFRALQAFTHGFNFLVAFVDLLIAGLPMKWPHLWAPVAYAFTYIIFNFTYVVAGGTTQSIKWGPYPNIYKILSWNSAPGLAAGVSFGVAFVAMPLLFAVCTCTVFPLLAKADCCPVEHPGYKGMFNENTPLKSTKEDLVSKV